RERENLRAPSRDLVDVFPMELFRSHGDAQKRTKINREEAKNMKIVEDRRSRIALRAMTQSSILDPQFSIFTHMASSVDFPTENRSRRSVSAQIAVREHSHSRQGC